MNLPPDPIVVELLPTFCDDWQRKIDADWWPRVVDAGSRDGLRHFGHTVVGSFAQYGLPEGARIGHLLLACAKEGDWVGAARHVEALRGVLRDVRRSLSDR